MSPEPNEKESISTKLTGALWDRVANFFSVLWDKFWDNAALNTAKILSPMSSFLLEDILNKELTPLYDRMEAVQADAEMPPAMKKLFMETVSKPGIANHLLGIGYLMLYQAGYTFSILPATFGKAKLQANKDFTPAPIDLGFLINLYYKNPEIRPLITEKACENGYSPSDVQHIFDGARSMLDPEAIRELYLRDELTTSDKQKLLSAQGYEDESIEQLTKLYKVIPPINDLVRMAVREAFTPNIVSEYQLHSDLPPDFVKWAQTKGLDDFWTKAYWAAHWELPSLTMAFEMYHRGVITQEEIMLLMRTQDIMPYWRDKILEISHTPFTRVDVRRMYAAGILDKGAVFTAYKDIGYDDEKAEKMTDFTVKWTQETEKDLTKGEILDGYKKGIISESDALYLIGRLGYDENECEFYIVRAQYDLEKKTKELSLTNIRKFYLKGILSLNETLSRLGALNLPADEIKFLIQDWDIEKEDKTKSFPLAELHKLFKAHNITIDIYREELNNLGFSNKYIEWFILLYRGE